MSVSAVAAAGTALALYYYGRRGGVCSGSGEPVETHVGLVQAPTSFMDDLFFLAEGLRWVVVSHRVDRGGSCTCREELLSPCREEQRRAGLACLGRHPAAATAQAAGAPAPAACRLPSVPQAGSCVAPLQVHIWRDAGALAHRRLADRPGLPLPQGKWRLRPLPLPLGLGPLSPATSMWRPCLLTACICLSLLRPSRTQRSIRWQTLHSWGGPLGAAWRPSSGQRRW